MIWIDGKPVEATEETLATDGGLLFGASLFETMKLADGSIRYREAHLHRLRSAAALLGWPQLPDGLAADLDRLAALHPHGIFRLRLTLTAGDYQGLAPASDRCRTILTVSPYTPPTVTERQQGCQAVIAANRRVNPVPQLPQLKSGNYFDCLIAAAAARAAGVREALFRDDVGQLLEGATSNLFIVRGQTLMTPPCGHEILDGIMRQQVLRLAPSLGWAVAEISVHQNSLTPQDGAFLTNALIGILPLSSIAEIPLRTTWPWAPLQQLVDAF